MISKYIFAFLLSFYSLSLQATTVIDPYSSELFNHIENEGYKSPSYEELVRIKEKAHPQIQDIYPGINEDELFYSIITEDNAGNTLAHLAARKGDIVTLSLLKEAGWSLYTENKALYTPLHFAVRKQLIGAVLEITNSPESLDLNSLRGKRNILYSPRDEIRNIDLYNRKGVAPLHYAAYLGNLEITEALVHSGADINAITEPPDCRKGDRNGGTFSFLEQIPIYDYPSVTAYTIALEIHGEDHPVTRYFQEKDALNYFHTASSLIYDYNVDLNRQWDHQSEIHRYLRR